MRSGINEFCALETIDQNEELIKMTLSLMMATGRSRPRTCILCEWQFEHTYT